MKREKHQLYCILQGLSPRFNPRPPPRCVGGESKRSMKKKAVRNAKNINCIAFCRVCPHAFVPTLSIKYVVESAVRYYRPNFELQ